jgi:hypothetical protein
MVLVGARANKALTRSQREMIGTPGPAMDYIVTRAYQTCGEDTTDWSHYTSQPPFPHLVIP